MTDDGYPSCKLVKVTALDLVGVGGYFLLPARATPRLIAETTRLRILTQRLIVSM